MRTVVLLISACCFCGCFTTRSIVFGQTAAALGPGAAEVGVSAGGGLHFLSSSPTPTSPSNSTTGVTLPWTEANAQFGLSEQVGLNFHLSPAGLQPGVKVSWAQKDIAFAILPELGFGLVSGSSSQSGSTRSSSTSLTNFMIGSKFLLSHRGGVYGGAGYDFQSWHYSQDPSQSATVTNHAISLAIGYNSLAGSVSLRPELSFWVSPTSSSDQRNYVGSSQVSLLFTVTVALQTGQNRAR